jgi:hypothetical protein
VVAKRRIDDLKAVAIVQAKNKRDNQKEDVKYAVCRTKACRRYRSRARKGQGGLKGVNGKKSFSNGIIHRSEAADKGKYWWAMGENLRYLTLTSSLPPVPDHNALVGAPQPIARD